MWHRVEKNSITQSARQIAYRFVAWQALTVVVITILWLLSGLKQALSALLGGATVVIPSLYFAHRFFATTSACAVKKIVKSFYIGELIKLLLSCVMVLLIVLLLPYSIIPLVTGLAGAQLGFWLAPLVIKMDTITSNK